MLLQMFQLLSFVWVMIVLRLGVLLLVLKGVGMILELWLS